VERSRAVRYTYQDLLSIPESHARHEIIDGELFVTPLARWNHQKVAANLIVMLASAVRAPEGDLGTVVGPMTVRLHDDLVLEPDVVFVRAERMRIVDPEGHVHGPPDLVVEILSPSTQRYDWNVKRKRYLESGVPELWIVDVDDRAVDVLLPGGLEPRRVRDALRWRVGERSIDLPLTDVFRGVR